jgi:hypothetical protein
MKKNRKSNTFNCLFIWAILLFTSPHVHAQTKQKWFRQELGVAQSAVYDNAHSLIKYKGTGAQLHIGNDYERPKSISQFDNAFIWTPLTGQVKDVRYEPTAQQANYRISYAYLRKLAKTQGNSVKIAVGGSVSSDVNARFYPIQNNLVSWDINLGLNIVGRAQYDFQLKRHSFSMTYQLGLPLLTYNHSPNYLGSLPLSAGFEGKAGTGTNWSALGRGVVGVNSNYFYLTQQINLDKIMHNGNKIRLGYNWQYANNGFVGHKYQNILSGFSLGVLTNFSKKTKGNN